MNGKYVLGSQKNARALKVGRYENLLAESKGYISSKVGNKKNNIQNEIRVGIIGR